jgi:DNA-binding MarR family transcriptional regulator
MDQNTVYCESLSEEHTQEDVERILSAWLRVTTAVSSERQLSDMRYNEALVCNILLRHDMENPDGNPLTATDLCRKSNILKSQMNRTLQAMEDRGIILRERNDADHRQVLISLNDESHVFDREHSKVLRVVASVMDRMGWEHADEIVTVLNAISDAAEEVLD